MQLQAHGVESTSSPAYVQQDLANLTDVYLQAVVTVPAATHTGLAAESDGYGIELIEVDYASNGNGIFLGASSGVVSFWTDFSAEGAFFTVSPDTAYTIDLRMQAGSPPTATVRIDGVQVHTGTEGNNNTSFQNARFGIVDLFTFGGSADWTVLVDSIKIGTTGYGSTDILSEDFEGASPLSNFSSTSGDVSVVSGGGGGGGGLGLNVAVISGLEFARDKSMIINEAISTPQGIADADYVDQVVKDTTSIATYGVRSVSFENLLTKEGLLTGNDDLTETKLYATYIVDNYADAKTRVSRVELRTQDPDGQFGAPWWAFVCGVEIGDVVTLTTTDQAPGFSDDFYVEGVHYDAVPMNNSHPDVTLVLDLSPKALYTTKPSGF